ADPVGCGDAPAVRLDGFDPVRSRGPAQDQGEAGEKAGLPDDLAASRDSGDGNGDPGPGQAGKESSRLIESIAQGILPFGVTARAHVVGVSYPGSVDLFAFRDTWEDFETT